MIQRNDNDSPRQPVWSHPVKRDPQGWPEVVQIVFGGRQMRAVTLDTRRCLCGARPNPAGILPCDH